MGIETEFANSVEHALSEAEKVCQLRVTDLRIMILKHGHLEAVKRLLQSQKMSEGFAKLVNASRLDLSVESVALQTKFKPLFADDERLIGSWEVTRTEDGINLRADARDPHSLARDPI